MVDTITAQFISAYSQQRPQVAPEPSLTTEQEDVVDDILSRYDSSALDDADIQEINEQFAAAGITPSAALRELVETNGFDAQELARDSIVPDRQSPAEAAGAPQPPSEEFLETLSNILQGYQGRDTLSAEDVQNIRDELASSGFEAPGAQLVRVDA